MSDALFISVALALAVIIGSTIGGSIGKKAKLRKQIENLPRVHVEASLDRIDYLVLSIHNGTEFILSFVDIEVTGTLGSVETSRTFRVDDFGKASVFKSGAASPFKTYKVEIAQHHFKTSTVLSARAVKISI